MQNDDQKQISGWQGLAWSLSLVVAVGLGALLQQGGYLISVSPVSGISTEERKAIDVIAKLGQELSDRVWRMEGEISEIKSAVNRHFRERGIQPIGSPAGTSGAVGLPVGAPEAVPKKK